jgi:hypothetical protein
MLTRPKSAAEKKLQAAQMAALHIKVLTDLRSEMYCAKVNQGSEHLEWYGDAIHGESIGAGIAALAALIDSEIDDAHDILPKAEREVAHG